MLAHIDVGILGDGAVVEDDVVLHHEMLQVAAHCIAVNAQAELIEHDVIRQRHHSVLVLDVQAVAVTAVGGIPTVVINEAAVGFGIRRSHKQPHATARVVDDQVDQLDARGAYLHAVRNR